MSEKRRVYIISVAAQITGMHPQTLRTYDRLGLVSPRRTDGQDRRYQEEDLEQLRHIRDLARSGVNLAGIQRILALENEVTRLRAALRAARTGDLSDTEETSGSSPAEGTTQGAGRPHQERGEERP